MRVIKAVIFDFFGVLCSNEYWRYVRKDGKVESVFHDYADKVNKGTFSWDGFMRKVADAKGVSVDEVNKMYETERIDPRVAAFIHELKDTYKTGLLTNAHHDFIDNLLEENHLTDIFDSVVVSSRVGAIKPSKAIYEQSLKELGVEPEEAIFIDDIARNTDGASELGIHTVVFEDFTQAKKDIQRLLNDQSE